MVLKYFFIFPSPLHIFHSLPFVHSSQKRIFSLHTGAVCGGKHHWYPDKEFMQVRVRLLLSVVTMVMMILTTLRSCTRASP